MGLAAAACMLLGVNSSEAAVTLSFAQVGANVTATWSGSYDLPSAPTIVYDAPSDGSLFIAGVAFGVGGGFNFMYANSSGVGFSHGPSSMVFGSYVGDTFGFSSDELYYRSGGTGTYAPTGTMTFTGKTLAELGASSFENTLAYRGTGSVDGSREILFTTVPEPTSALLSALGASMLLRRRRRQAA